MARASETGGVGERQRDIGRPVASAPRTSPRSAAIGRDGLLSAGLNLLLVGMVALPLLQCILFTLNILGASYTGYDFSVYYAAALALRANPHANIFDPHLLRAVAQAHGAALPAVVYTSPSLLAVFMLPLALFPYRVALGIWTILNLAVWLFCAVLLASWLQRAVTFGAAPLDPGDAASRAPLSAQTARVPRLFTLALALFLTLSYQPIEQSLVLGQVSLFVLFLLVLVPLLVERDRPYLAGGVLALAIWIKLFPAVLVVYYLARGRWRVVVGAIGGVALLALAQVPLIGVDGVLATRYVLDNGAFQAAQFHNEALARVPLWIAAEFGGHLSPVLALAGDALVAIIAILFLAGLLHLRRWKPEGETHEKQEMAGPIAANRELLGYTWALCTMVLVAPITWEHYDAWLLPALVMCLGLAIRASATGFRDARGRIQREVYVLAAIIIAYAITMYNLPLGYDGTTTFAIGPDIGGHPLRPFFMLLRPLGALLAWVCSGALLLRATLHVTSQHNATSADESRPPAPALSLALHLPRSVQACVLAGLLFAVIAMQAVLAAVITAFGPYQPH